MVVALWDCNKLIENGELMSNHATCELYQTAYDQHLAAYVSTPSTFVCHLTSKSMPETRGRPGVDRL